MIKTLFFFFTLFPLFSQNLTQIRKDIKTLASKEFAGRGYINEGHTKAAEYIRKRFRNAGLQSPENTENYFQNFSAKIYVISSANLKIGKKNLKIGADFLPHPASAGKCISTKYIRINTEEIPEKKIKNKIVILKEKQSKISERLNQAVKHGASGIIILQKKPVHSLLSEKYGRELPVPVMKVFQDSIRIRKRGKINLCVRAHWKKVTPRNVIGYLKGESDSLIILSAHYDHLGQIDTATFYGANDNASGTSLLLALADTLGKVTPKYTLVFIAFAGEEAGLLGSMHYVMHPVFPLQKTKFVINLDLWGFGEKGAVAVAGKEYPGLFKKIKILADTEKFPLTSRANRPNSDHYFFTQKNIPALFFYANGGTYYHDIWDKYETLSLAGIPKMYRVLVQLLSR